MVALAVQGAYFCVWAFLYTQSMRLVDVTLTWKRSFPLTFASLFVNTIAPTAGTGGSALFANQSRATRQSTTHTVIGYLFAIFIDLVSLLMVVVVALQLLHRQGMYLTGASVSGWMLTGLISIMVLAVLISRYWPKLIKRVLNGVAWLLVLPDRVRRRKPSLLPTWAATNTAKLQEASTLIFTRRWLVANNLLITFGMHFLGLLTLSCLFLAFAQPINWAMIFASYSMMMLFWIVSPTPQGIGVVEVVGAYVLTALGQDPLVAVGIAVGYRAVSYWLPIIVGFIFLTRIDRLDQKQQAITEAWQVQAVSFLAGITGLVNVISAAVPGLPQRLHVLSNFTPFDVQYSGRLTAVIAGFALIVLSQALMRRQSAAYWSTMVLLLVSAVAHLVKGLDYEETTLAVSVALFLFTQRRQFYALADRPTIWRGLRVLGIAVVVVLLYGTIGLMFLDEQFATSFTIPQAAWQTVVIFTSLHNPGIYPLNHLGQAFLDTLYALGGMTGIYAVLILFAPAFSREPSTEECRRVNELVRDYGKSPLAAIALLPDKRYFFTEGSVIPYTDRGRAAVALGDPIGPTKNARKAIGEFCALARRTGREPAFYQGSEGYKLFYEKAGFSAVQVGQEAIIDVEKFTLEGGSRKRLRLNKRRWETTGFSTAILEPPFNSEIIEELRSISLNWLSKQHGREKKFSLGWFDEAYLQRNPMAVAYAPDGSVVAFTNILILEKAGLIAIDLMRRHNETMSGVMEYLITDLILWAQPRGYKKLSLGLSPLYDDSKDGGPLSVTKLLQYVYTNMNQLYSFKGLQGFKAKFHPDWEPRYLYYKQAQRLPAVVHTLLRAGSGDWYYFIYAWDWIRRFGRSE